MKYQSYQISAERDELLSISDGYIIPEKDDSFSFVRLLKFGTLTLVLATCGLLAFTGNKVFTSIGLLKSKQMLSSSTYSIEVEVESPGYDQLAALIMLPWDTLAEPFREQILSVSSFVVDGEEVDLDSDSSYVVSWTIGSSILTGNGVSFVVNQTGVLDCSVTIAKVAQTSKPFRRRLRSSSDTRRSTPRGDFAPSTQITIETTETNTPTNSVISDVSSPSVIISSDVGTTDVYSVPSDITASDTTATVISNIPSDVTSTDVVQTDIPSDVSQTDVSSGDISVSDVQDVNSLDIEIIDEDSSESDYDEVYTLDFTMAVKYVRREIRSMTDDDRTTFFSALKLMYTLSQAEGKRTYGDKFNTAEYYSYKHLNGAGTTDCDHWHDGAGIVTHHMAFTLEAEQTLQAINPTISMPYWEYGMDFYLYTNWWESPIFDADWFGEANPAGDDHAISDGGLWDGVEVPSGDSYSNWSIAETGSLNPFVNAYGDMRSPWNNNPVRRIGRHNQTYGTTQYKTTRVCSTLQNCFMSTSFADISECLNGATHGPVHILIGGAWGEGTLFDDPDIDFIRMPDKLLFFKVLWRMGYTRCPDTCTLGERCRCAVPDEYIDTYGAYAILEATNVVYALASHLTDADDDLYMKVLRAVEDPGIAGEMFSSAAAFDPSFWPLHGALERLADLKRILVSQGDITTFDEAWEYITYNKTSGAVYLNGVCDWSRIGGSGDLTMPTCTLDTICFGHHENDLMEFSGFLGQNDAYTNKEFWDLMHPWNEDLPYTYDTFDYDYCEEEGYAFDATTTTVDTLDPNMPSDITSDTTLPMDPTSGGTDVILPSSLGPPPSAVKNGVAASRSARKSSAKSSTKSSKKSSISTRHPYKGYAAGKSPPPKSSRTAPKSINTQPIKLTQLLSESMQSGS
jgi:hypothetical protein